MFQGTWGGKLSPKTPINPLANLVFFLYRQTLLNHYGAGQRPSWWWEKYCGSVIGFWQWRSLTSREKLFEVLATENLVSVFGLDLIACWKTNTTSELYYQTLIHGAVPIVNNTNIMLCYEGNKRENFWHKWTEQISCVQCLHPAGNQDILLTIRKPLDPVTSVTNLMLCQLTRRVLHVCCTETHWWQPNVSVMCMHIPLLINSFWKQDSSKMDYTETRQVRVSMTDRETFSSLVNPWVTVMWKCAGLLQ